VTLPEVRTVGYAVLPTSSRSVWL